MRYRVQSLFALGFSLAGLLVSSVPSSALAGKYPEPSVYPISWELTLKHSKPKRIVLDVPGRSTPTAFWYMTYTVINNTKNDQYFTPRFDMLTEDGRVFRSDDRKISPPVIAEIRKRERNASLKSAADLVREPKLLQGEDQAKDGVAVWEEPEANMRSFTIFVGGLSGEFVKMKDDDGKELKDSEGSPIFLRKTLELGYTIHGGSAAPEEDQIQPKPEKWVMR